MTFGEFKKIINTLDVPDTAELCIDDGCVNEEDEVNLWNPTITVGLLKPREVEYRDSPAFIFSEFDLKGLGLTALAEMKSRLGVDIRPAIVFDTRPKWMKSRGRIRVSKPERGGKL